MDSDDGKRVKRYVPPPVVPAKRHRSSDDGKRLKRSPLKDAMEELVNDACASPRRIVQKGAESADRDDLTDTQRDASARAISYAEFKADESTTIEDAASQFEAQVIADMTAQSGDGKRRGGWFNHAQVLATATLFRPEYALVLADKYYRGPCHGTIVLPAVSGNESTSPFDV